MILIENEEKILIYTSIYFFNVLMIKKLILIWLLGVCVSPVFASQKFTIQENTQIDQKINSYTVSWVDKLWFEQLKKQSKMLNEVVSQLSYIADTWHFLWYGVAKYPTPVLHYPIWFPSLDKTFGANPYTGLNLDDYQQIDELDFVAVSGTVFTIIAKVQTGDYVFYQVRTREFGTTTPDEGYYVDSRFIDIKKSKPVETIIRLPSLSEIYQRLLMASGTVYVRWGNIPTWIDQLNDFYPSTWQTTDLQKSKKILKWVDCSGLLYRATKWYTPRNTSELVVYGTGLHIKWLTIDQIVTQVKPLDLITWAGHVMIILNKDRVIESRRGANDSGGTKIRPLKDVLVETMKSKSAANDYYDDPRIEGKKNFVIRRWFSWK